MKNRTGLKKNYLGLSFRVNPFAKIDEKHAEWQSLQPLNPEDHKRFWKKMRLEWNYHSNRIEGNTLTYGETELLFIYDRAVGDHTIRNYEEMKAHDVAISHLLTLVEDGRSLTSGDIRDLNKLLLKEPFIRPAITPEDQPTTNEIIPGQFKKHPNNVRTANGELFEFTSPSEVPAAIQDLLDWSNGEHDSHPVEIAAKLHHRFVCIHPFGDGNGRTARLLTNYSLMRSHFPPVVIRSDEKDTYLGALQQADIGNLAPFISLLTRRVDVSLQLGIQAAKGKSIEETDDIDKEIEFFRRNQSRGNPVPVPKNSDSVKQAITETVLPLIAKLSEDLVKLDDLFVDRHVQFQFNSQASSYHPEGTGKHCDVKVFFENIIEKFDNERFETLENFRFTYTLKDYAYDISNRFDATFYFDCQFDESQYHITSSMGDLIESNYGQLHSSQALAKFSQSLLKKAFESIRKTSEQIQG